MRTALLSDIHGNKEALSACLAHAVKLPVDRFAILGDLVGYGADPVWVVDRVRELSAGGAVVVIGNHDDAALGSPHKTMRSDARQAIVWTQSQLNEEQRIYLASLPLRVEEGGHLYVHANPWAPGRWDYITAEFEAGKGFAATKSRYVFFGHVHVPMLYHQDATGRVESHRPVHGVEIPFGARRWLVNLGSVGQPRDGIPAACYAVCDDVRRVVTYYRVPYDAQGTARKIVAAGLPEWFGARLLEGR